MTIDRDGTFTYVPFPSERDDTAVGEETLGFRAVDPRGASAYITVTVPISPRHIGTPPDPRSAMGLPDPETGVVTGSCGHTGAGYTYAASAAAKGTVMIDAATGIWAYRPAAAARHEAVADGASMAERHDNFTVTVSNGKRDKVVVPVSVPLVSMQAVASYAVTAEIACHRLRLLRRPVHPQRVGNRCARRCGRRDPCRLLPDRDRRLAG